MLFLSSFTCLRTSIFVIEITFSHQLCVFQIKKSSSTSYHFTTNQKKRTKLLSLLKLIEFICTYLSHHWTVCCAWFWLVTETSFPLSQALNGRRDCISNSMENQSRNNVFLLCVLYEMCAYVKNDVCVTRAIAHVSFMNYGKFIEF